MAVNYSCDWCHTVGDSLQGWLLLHISFQHYDQPAPGTPGAMEDGVRDLIFDKKQCRDNWLARAELDDPTTGPA